MEQSQSSVVPTDITLRTRNKVLVIQFDNGEQFELPCEYLRVFSPAAEVRAHAQNGTWEVGKERVNIEKIESVGSYAVQLYFDDGHNTGVYSWKTLYDLGKGYEANWQSYLQFLEKNGFKRSTDEKALHAKAVTLLYFVTLVPLFDMESERVNLPGEVDTVQNLLEWLWKRGTKWEKSLALDGVTVTINKQFVELDTRLEDGDEIAIVPTRSIIVKR